MKPATRQSLLITVSWFISMPVVWLINHIVHGLSPLYWLIFGLRRDDPKSLTL